MRYAQLLLEFNVDVTAKKLGGKIRARFEDVDFHEDEPQEIYNAFCSSIGAVWPPDAYTDPGALSRFRAKKEKHQDEYQTAIIRGLISYDPTPNKMYSRWICERYVSGGIARWDDLTKVRNALTFFHGLKTSGYFKRNPGEAKLADIGRFDSLPTLAQFLYSISDDAGVSNAARDRQMEEDMVTNGDVSIILNTERFKVVIPHSETAASHFGRNTQWCTTSENGGAFKSYAREGPLFIILDKPVNKRWQFHYPSEQFMDENDRSIFNFGVMGVSLPAEFWSVVPKEMVQETRFFTSIPMDKIRLLPEDVWDTLGHNTAQWITMHQTTAVNVLAQAPESYVAKIAEMMSWSVLLTTMAMYPSSAKVLEQYLSGDDLQSKDVSNNEYVMDFYFDYASAVAAEVRDNGIQSAWMKDFIGRLARKEMVHIPDIVFSIERVGKTIVLQDGQNRYFLCSVNNYGTQEIFAIALEGESFKHSGYMNHNVTMAKLGRTRKSSVFGILPLEIEMALHSGYLSRMGART